MTKFVSKLLAACICAGTMACTVQATTGTTEECRTVVRGRHDVEVCVSSCGDEGCRTRCRERERWSREHRCWVE
ncbi:MAG: hypothetical protein ACLP1X_19155 [Polyangiaceae bacterium]|jgi:hypothetical protein